MNQLQQIDTTELKQATLIDTNTMSVPQPAPEPIIVSKDDIIARMTQIQSVIDRFTAQLAIQQSLLDQANELGLQTKEETLQNSQAVRK